MMDKRAVHMVEPFVKAGYDLEAAAILLCESDGTDEEVDDEIARMQAVFQQAGATRLQVSSSEQERLLFWAGRKNAFPAAGRSEEHTSELQSLMRNSYAVFCLKKKQTTTQHEYSLLQRNQSQELINRHSK